MKQLNTLHFLKTFRRCFRAVLFLSCLAPLLSQAQNISLNWARALGGGDLIGDGTTTVDASGNVYMTGYFMGTADFDPGPATANLTANGIDMFLAKYDSNGNYLWAKKMGAASYNDQAYAIAVDGSGNAYITGIFAATVDFDPGAGVGNLTSNGATDIFIAKYDASGNYVWARNMGGSDWDYGQSITLDNAGHVYVAGSFVDTAYFGTAPAATSIISAGSTDVLLAKYDTSGNFIWGKALGGTSGDDAQKVTTDIAGNVYVTGRYMLTADFDPGPGTANLTASGGTDIFMAKYSGAGTYIWAKGIGGTGYDAPSDLVVNAGQLYMVGIFAGTADFDPGAGVANLVSNATLGDAYLAKYDTSGAYLWAKHAGPAGTANSANANGVALSATGDVYFTGSFNGTVDFDPGAGVANLTATGYKDIFAAKYNAAGNYLWAGRMGGTPISASSNCGGRTIARNATGQLYLAGYFSGTVDFDPGAGVSTLTDISGGGSVFMIKLADGCPSYSTLTQTHCDSFSFHNVTYTTSGVYVDTLTSLFNCDSIVTLNLTINHSVVNPVITGQYCDSVTFNGVTYDTTGVYTQHYFSFNGCDSNITYNITIKGKSNSSQLTVNACGPYVFNDSTYTASGNFLVVLENAQGCDSLVTLSLTVHPRPVATVIKTGSILTANNADAYQWINCSDRSAIAGANSQSYTVTATGSYAAVITKNSCSDTSDCMTVDVGTGIDDLAAVNPLQIYPNPANARINIVTEQPLRQATIRLSNVIGQVLQEHRKQSGRVFYLDISAYAEGVYLVEIAEGNKISRRKIVKK